MKSSLAGIACVIALGAALVADQGCAQDSPDAEERFNQNQRQLIVGPDEARRDLQATDLSVDADCSAIYAGERTAVFEWVPAPRGERVRLDITRYYNGWETGQFETLAVLDGNADRYEWERGEPAAEYLWRVLTFADGKWYASEASRYAVPVCVGDEGESDEENPDGADPQ